MRFQFLALSCFSLLAAPALVNAESDSEPVGSTVISQADTDAWFASLSQADEDRLASIFDDTWFASISEEERANYAHLAHSLYTFVGSGADSHAQDHYVGFSPLLLRASFHSSGTFDRPTGTGGSNGGTIFNDAELEDAQNGCIDIATNALQELFAGSRVPLADAMVISGVVALDDMNFPRMDLVKIVGGRRDFHDIAYRNRLSSADDDPTHLFMEQYGFTMEELVALIGGAHNFGSAHGHCSGYIGQWTSSPLSWSDPETGAPSFFVDLFRTDWVWREVCTYANDTSTYTTIPDPFANGTPDEEEEEEEEGGGDACLQAQSEEPLICEAQAMRGCDFEDGNYPVGASPCDINLLQFRLTSDFFLKENPMLRPHAQAFADDPDLLAEQFGIAYHKLTHNGLERCGLSGHGCQENTECTATNVDEATGRVLAETCTVSDEVIAGLLDGNVDRGDCEDDDDEEEWSLSRGGSLAVLTVLAIMSTLLFVGGLMVFTGGKPQNRSTAGSTTSKSDQSSGDEQT